MIIRDIEQGSPEWHELRAKRITGSRAKDVIGKRKDGKGYLGARETYKTEKIVELLTGLVAEDFSTAATRWGNEQEPHARLAYEMRTGIVADKVSFIIHPTIPYLGCSPDSLIGDDGMNEIKCPYNSTNHLDTLINGMPDEHMPQVQTNLMVAGRKWCDFISYDPRFPHPLDLYVKRIFADAAYHEMLAKEFAQFWAEVNVDLNTLNQLKEAMKV